MCTWIIGESLLGDNTNATSNRTTHIYPTYPTHVAEGIVNVCMLYVCMLYVCMYVCVLCVYVCVCMCVCVCVHACMCLACGCNTYIHNSYTCAHVCIRTYNDFI